MERANAELVGENKLLREEIEKAKRYCWKCKIELGIGCER